jgi:hypothetical protein
MISSPVDKTAQVIFKKGKSCSERKEYYTNIYDSQDTVVKHECKNQDKRKITDISNMMSEIIVGNYTAAQYEN